MNQDISPEVKMISPAAINLIRQLEDGYVDIMDSSATRPRPQHTPTV